jgi:hypothetical protein
MLAKPFRIDGRMVLPATNTRGLVGTNEGEPRTVANTIELRRAKNVVFMPISQVTSLREIGRGKGFDKIRIMDGLDIHEVENLQGVVKKRSFRLVARRLTFHYEEYRIKYKELCHNKRVVLTIFCNVAGLPSRYFGSELMKSACSAAFCANADVL